jgi:hypothetical protein
MLNASDAHAHPGTDADQRSRFSGYYTKSGMGKYIGKGTIRVDKIQA